MKRPNFDWPDQSCTPLPGVADLNMDELPEAFREFEQTFVRMCTLLSEADKVQLFLDAIRIPQVPRKDVIRDLARVAGCTEKDMQALSDQQKARIYARRQHRLSRRINCILAIGPFAEKYFDVANKFLDEAEKSIQPATEIFARYRESIPLTLWGLTLHWIRTKGDSEKRREVIRQIRDVLPSSYKIQNLPFGVGELPTLTPLDHFLLDLHERERDRALPLLRSLTQINRLRPENRLLFALTGLESDAPQSLQERAWDLCGRLLRWGLNLETADERFDFGDFEGQKEVIRAIFEDPKLAPVQQAVGDYLLRQVLGNEQVSFLVDILPAETFRELDKFLEPVVKQVADARALREKPEQLQALISRFPFLKGTDVLATCLRKNGQFEAALAELNRIGGNDYAIELCEAQIADALALELPEGPTEQEELKDRLEEIAFTDAEGNPEASYCQALYRLLEADSSESQNVYDDLQDLGSSPKSEAYRLLAALQSKQGALLREAIEGLDSTKFETYLTIIPTNLLRAGIRSLLLLEDPTDATEFCDVLYQHSPDLLDPLLGSEDFIHGCPALLKRFLDKAEQAKDPIQKWAAYQKTLEMANGSKNAEIVARVVDASLAIQEPLLAPYQVRLLTEQINACADLDLKELLVDKLMFISAEEAKPFLYQLLQTYRGNSRMDDAVRVAEILRELGENSEALSLGKSGSAQTLPAQGNGRLPRPILVGFYGGDECERNKTEQLRRDLMQKHPGLTLEFDHSGWNNKNLSALLTSVGRYDVIVASNLMRTQINHGLRQRAREQGKTFGFCRNRGIGTIAQSILQAVEEHLKRAPK